MLILEKVHVGFETNWKVPVGSGSEKIHSGSPALPGRSPKFIKLQPDYANFRKSSCRIRNQLKSRIRIRKKKHSGSGPQHCQEGHQSLQNYNKIIPWSGTVGASSPASAVCACASRPPGWRCSAWNLCPEALKTRYCIVGISIFDRNGVAVLAVLPDPDLDPRIHASD